MKTDKEIEATPTDRAARYAKEMTDARSLDTFSMPLENRAMTDWINGFSAGRKESIDQDLFLKEIRETLKELGIDGVE